MNSWEAEWEAVQAAAHESYEAARTKDACQFWRYACELAADMAPDDPRRAASASNAGLALLIDGNIAEAESRLDEAVALWSRASAWVDTMEIAQTARSSLFHFRLEQRHADTYASVRRAWNKNLLMGSTAVTTFNQALVYCRRDNAPLADKLFRQSIEVRQLSCGNQDHHLAMMTAVYAARPNADGARDGTLTCVSPLHRDPKTSESVQAWGARPMSHLCDQRRLDSAAYLTVPAHERDAIAKF